MQAAQHAALRARMVVLHEAGPQAGSGLEVALVEGLHEEAAIVAEYPGFEQDHIRDRESCGLHQ